MLNQRNTSVICFTNNKGGSGKSTSCANLGYELSQAGNKVLLIDGDMQLNLSLTLFPEDAVLEMAGSGKTLFDAICKKDDLKKYIVASPYDNLDLIPSSTLMNQVEYEIFNKVQREYILKKCLINICEDGIYDYILIDAPPTLGIWVINILCAANHIIVPVEASPWGLFGLANMFDFLSEMKDIVDADVMGVLITKVDERKSYYKQTRKILDSYSNLHIFNSFIHVDASIEWAQDESKPVAVYKKATRSSNEYKQLAKEVLEYGSRKR